MADKPLIKIPCTNSHCKNGMVDISMDWNMREIEKCSVCGGYGFVLVQKAYIMAQIQGLIRLIDESEAQIRDWRQYIEV